MSPRYTNVVDHQVVGLENANGVPMAFTMIGTSEFGPPRTTVYGTRGVLRTDQNSISTTTSPPGGPHSPGPRQMGRGRDHVLVADFLAAVAHRGRPGCSLVPARRLDTHLTVFGAERARRTECVDHVRNRYTGVRLRADRHVGAFVAVTP